MIRVLIVEDDPMVAEINKQFLCKIDNFEFVSIAPTVKEAINMINNTPVDLVLLDTYMPEENGCKLLMHIRREKINIDVIFITAARDMENVKKAIQYGAVDYLIKPFTFERFRDALTAYKERVTFMKKKEMLCQEDLDNMLLAREKSIETKELPKGLTKQTLQIVWDEIMIMDEEIFSTEDIAISVGVSRVSIRKYLQFLEKIDLLKAKVEYGFVGRPVTKYQYLKENKTKMEQYLS